MPDENDDIQLVCMRATAELAAPGSTYDRRCSQCNELVMVAPSGERFLKRQPTARIICTACHFASGVVPDEVHLPEDPATMLQEIASAVPNPFRSRN